MRLWWVSEQAGQAVDVFGRSGPTRGEAGEETPVGHGLPHLEAHFSVEALHLFGGEQGKLLVGGRVVEERDAFLLHRLPEAACLLDGVGGDAQVEAVGHKRVELHAEQAALGHEGSVLLDHGEELARRIAPGKDHGLAAEGSDLRAANVEHVAEAGQLRQREVALGAGQRVAQSGTIDEERQPIFAAHGVEGFQFGTRVDGAEFGGHRHVDHGGLHHVVARVVGAEGPEIVGQRGGGQFAVVGGQGDYLVSTVLHGAGFMDGNVPAVAGYDAVAGREHGVDDGGVGLCAAYEQEHGCLGAVGGLADAFDGAMGVVVVAVAWLLHEVGVDEALQDGGVCAFGIVAGE